MSEIVDILCDWDIEDIQLDAASGDIQLGTGSGRSTARAVRTILETAAGSWEWDLDYGVDWPQVLTRRRSDAETYIAQVVRDAISDVAVAGDIDVTIDTGSRSATLTVYVGSVPVTVEV